MTARAAGGILVLACILGACGRGAPEVKLPVAAAGREPARGMPLPLPATEVTHMLEREGFELRSLERATGGVTRVYRGLAHFPRRGVDLQIKWKLLPHGGDSWNNVARKEVAAFVVQRWFLEPENWLVPPTTVRCVPLEEHRKLQDAEPIVEDTQCVLGMAAAWLQDVERPEAVVDWERFERDLPYAHHRADLNLLGYLIDHRDGRLANFLVPKADGDPRIFVIDNGISFGGLVWNYFRPNWNDIRVPALRRTAIERLRRITTEDVSALLVLDQLEADPQGVLQPVKSEPPWDASDGTRLQPGRVQLGLTDGEAAGLGERLLKLIAGVDAGEVELF
jgi:hypothetical protein